MLFLLVVNISIFTVVCQKNMKSQKHFIHRKYSTNEVIKKSSLDAVPLFSIVVLFIGCNIPRLFLNRRELDVQEMMRWTFNSCEIVIEMNKLFRITYISKLCLILNSSANVLIYYSIKKLCKKLSCYLRLQYNVARYESVKYSKSFSERSLTHSGKLVIGETAFTGVDPGGRDASPPPTGAKITKGKAHK